MKSFLTLLTLTASLNGLAQVPAFQIRDLSFISGKWVTTTSWGEMEENWSTPLGNCMMCSYRCVKDGKIVFYEFIVIEQSADSVPVMKLRHFNPGNIGWEEKDKPYHYPLVELKSGLAKFERPDKMTSLTFHRLAPDRLQVTLDRVNKEGKKEQDIFDYSLAKQ